MSEQKPDQPDADAEAQAQQGEGEEQGASDPQPAQSGPPPAEGAKPADQDAVPDEPGVGQAGGSVDQSVDDVAAAALYAAMTAISEMNSETEGAAADKSASDSEKGGELDPALVDQMMADLDSDDAGGAEAGGRTIGKVSPRGGSPEGVELPALESNGSARTPEGIELLSDVNLQVKIELGRTVMLVEDVLRLNNGSIVELDKLAGDPVDVYVNDRHVARGEVLVLNDAFCVRISEVLAPVAQQKNE